jgi:adenine deaminase
VAVASETITREEIVDAVSIRGRILADPERDMALIAVFNRHESEPTGALGMARGLGLRSGAVAASLLWDTNNILAAGMSPAEMALAVNRLIELGGGLVVVRGKRVLAEMPMPVAGIISEKPIADLVKEAGQVEKALAGLGCGLTRPFLTLQNFCFTGLPFLRLTDKGLVDVRAGRLVPVIL